MPFSLVKTLVKTRATGKVEPKSELPQIADATTEFEEAIGLVLEYVEDVLADRVTPDNSIGRNLLKLVQAVPNMSRDELDNMMSANVKVSNKNINLLWMIGQLLHKILICLLHAGPFDGHVPQSIDPCPDSA